MPDLLVIVPTRGRPHNLIRLLRVWEETSVGVAQLLVAVDGDDPANDQYRAAVVGTTFAWMEVLPPFPGGGMAGPLNHWATRYAASYRAVGFMGDDHLPMSYGWDSRISEVLGMWPAAMCYGDDLLQHEQLPTAVFMTSNIVRRLGWMVPPGLRHLYIDNAWKELGQAARILSYLPEVVIEHVHPVAQKAAWDEHYARVNHPDLDRQDRAAFLAWRYGQGFTEAVWAIQQLTHPEQPQVSGG